MQHPSSITVTNSMCAHSHQYDVCSSLRCCLCSTGAHARALQHYETHVRAAWGGGLNAAGLRNACYTDAQVVFLQVTFLVLFL